MPPTAGAGGLSGEVVRRRPSMGGRGPGPQSAACRRPRADGAARRRAERRQVHFTRTCAGLGGRLHRSDSTHQSCERRCHRYRTELNRPSWSVATTWIRAPAGYRSAGHVSSCLRRAPSATLFPNRPSSVSRRANDRRRDRNRRSRLEPRCNRSASGCRADGDRRQRSSSTGRTRPRVLCCRRRSARGAMLALGTVVVGALLVWGLLPCVRWVWPASQMLTITKPTGGTITGPGIECGTGGNRSVRPRSQPASQSNSPRCRQGISCSAAIPADCAPAGRAS